MSIRKLPKQKVESSSGQLLAGRRADALLTNGRCQDGTRKGYAAIQHSPFGAMFQPFFSVVAGGGSTDRSRLGEIPWASRAIASQLVLNQHHIGRVRARFIRGTRGWEVSRRDGGAGGRSGAAICAVRAVDSLVIAAQSKAHAKQAREYQLPLSELIHELLSADEWKLWIERQRRRGITLVRGNSDDGHVREEEVT